MAKATITDATTKLYDILKGLESDERRRVVDATFMLLGEPPSQSIMQRKIAEEKSDKGGDADEDDSSLPTKAKVWMTKNGLTLEQLSNAFHFDNGAVACIELAGNSNSKRLKTIDTYLLQGIAALLTTGEPSFSDDDARKLCQHFGCYDQTNHAKSIKDFKNNITGTAKSGWKLTAPGLAAAAKLLKPRDGQND